MRKNPTRKIEAFRVSTGPLASSRADGANGAFLLRIGHEFLSVIVSDGSDWEAIGLPPPKFEHVSVSCPQRCPTWAEMDAIKRIFWRDDELVMQLHVPREDHINRHENCLHLWRPVGVAIPRPPQVCV